MNETLRVLNNLHTTHGNFTDKEVDELTLKTILETSVRGANASNRQSYSIIVIRGKEMTEKITGCGASVALLVCVDFNRLYDIGEHLGYPSDYDNMFNYLTAHTDAIIVAQTAVIAASSLGVGSLITNSIHHSFRRNLDDIYKELDLPNEHFFPVTAILLGYEDKEPEHKKGRLTDAGIVHYDKYNRLTSKQKDGLIEMINDPSQNFGGKGDCDNYLEFYYTKWAAPKSKETAAQMDAMLIEKMKSFLQE